MTTVQQNKTRGWGDGSMGQCLSCRARGMSSASSTIEEVGYGGVHWLGRERQEHEWSSLADQPSTIRKPRLPMRLSQKPSHTKPVGPDEE